MDLDRIRTSGISRTRTAWATNPVRAVLWKLMAPYFRGVVSESARHQTEFERCRGAELTTLREEAKAAATSYLTGLRKDTMAVGHRLGALEDAVEEATSAATAVERRLGTLEDAAEVAASALTQAREAAAYIGALHEEVRLSERAMGERIDSVNEEVRLALSQAVKAAEQARQTAAFLVSQQRGSTLRVGECLALGQDGLAVAATTAGANYLIRQDDRIGRTLAEGREWEPHLRAAIARVADSNGVAVDVGAEIGVHTVTMCRLFGMVHAFEPQQQIFQLLCGNLALNSCRNVVAHESNSPDSFELAGVTLLRVSAQYGLSGAENTIRRCRPFVLFTDGAEPDEFRDFLVALDYDVAVLADGSHERTDCLATPR